MIYNVVDFFSPIDKNFIHLLEKEMATHSSILAWRITWTEEPGGLQSMGLQRVGHDRASNIHTHMGGGSQLLAMGFIP